MWLACAEDGDLIATELVSLSLPSGMESGQQLAYLLEDSKRALERLAPDRVLILDPESIGKLTYAQSRRRVTGETLLTLAAAQAELPCDYVSRKALRKELGLPARGKLTDLVRDVVSEPLKPHWKNERDLAALAALAGQEHADAQG